MEPTVTKAANFLESSNEFRKTFGHLSETFSSISLDNGKSIVLCRIDKNPNLQEAEYVWILKSPGQKIKTGDYITRYTYGDKKDPVYEKE
jgi:hypothetical protein